MDLNRANTEVNAADFLLFTNRGEFLPYDSGDKTNEYQFMDDNKILENTLEHYQRVRDTLKTLYKAKSKSNS